MADELPDRLARNIRHLRAARGVTQEQMAKASGLPRATWANLESGEANPTLAVLHRVALALQVSIEELISPPRGAVRLHPKDSLPVRRPGQAQVRKLLPDPLPGLAIDRLELPPGGRFNGVPHTAGTREYLTCEAGLLSLTVEGKEWRLGPGDVLSFRGDQRHAYGNPGERTAVGYSVVLLAPIA